MKRRINLFIIVIFIVFFMVSALFVNLNRNTNNKDNTKVTVAEVAHTIFYAPQYVAIEEGYFEDVGIDIELILASGVKS